MRHQRKIPNILLITIDAVRFDRLTNNSHGKNIAPNLCQISKESTVFTNAISNAPWTLPSIASIFTGLYPSEHGATQETLQLREEVNTIAEILSNAGYDTIGISSNAWISESTGLSKGFRDFKDWRSIRVNSLPFHKFLGSLGDPLGFSRKLIQYFAAFYVRYIIRKDVTMLIVEFVENYLLEKKDNSKPFFIFLNLLDAHLPYNPRFQEMFLTKKEMEIATSFKKDVIQKRDKYLAGIKVFSAKEIDVLNKLYNCAVFLLDFNIGKLVDYLRVTGILDNTLLIVTADHGENIGDHELIGHQLCLYDTLIKVPLIIRYPPCFQGDRIIERQVETKDLFYTILDVVENSLNSDLEGSNKMKSMMREIQSDDHDIPAFGEYAKPVYTLGRIRKYSKEIPSKYKCRSKFIRKDNYKYIWYEDAADEFYDLKLDPNEEKNIMSKNPDKLVEMKRLLNEKMEEFTNSFKGYDKGTKNIDAEIRKRLRDLGYFE